jgi:hypothetical protein
VSLTTVAIDEGTCEGMSVFPSFAGLRSIRRTCYYNKNKNNLVTQGFMWLVRLGLPRNCLVTVRLMDGYVWVLRPCVSGTYQGTVG